MGESHVTDYLQLLTQMNSHLFGNQILSSPRGGWKPPKLCLASPPYLRSWLVVDLDTSHRSVNQAAFQRAQMPTLPKATAYISEHG